MTRLVTITLILSIAFGASLATNCDIFEWMCENSDFSCPSTVSSTMNASGVSLPYNMFDCISFGDIVIPRGDIQGRAMCRDNFICTQEGVSIGDQIDYTKGDAEIPYSLVVGKDAHWLEGALFPSIENFFVGGTFYGDSYLSAKVSGNCSSSGCLNSQFDQSEAYWKNYSSSLSSKSSNANYTILYGAITLDCSSYSSASIYYVNIDGAEFSSITSYSSVSCSASAVWIFNIKGTSDVVFDGTPFAGQSGIIYNFAEAAYIEAKTFIYGSVLCPYSTFNQTSGTVFGKLITKTCQLVQINRPGCPNHNNTTGQTTYTSGGVTGQANSTGYYTSGQGNTTDQGNTSASTGTQSGSVTGDATGVATTSSETGSATAFATSSQTGSATASATSSQTGSASATSSETGSITASATTEGVINNEDSGLNGVASSIPSIAVVIGSLAILNLIV